MASFATQRLHDRRGESRGMTRVRRSDEVAIDDDRRILHPGCTGGFRIGLHHEFGVGDAVVEPRHAMASDNLRAGCQQRSTADAGDDPASRPHVLYEFSDARIFGEQGRAFGATWYEDAHIVLGPGVRNCALDVQQAGPCEVAVNLDRLLTRGHHLDLIAGLVESDLGKEVLLLLKRVSDEGGNLWALIGHRKSPFAVVRKPCRTAHGFGKERAPAIRSKGAPLTPHSALRSAGGPSIRRNADRTNNAAFAKNEERSLLFF